MQEEPEKLKSWKAYTRVRMYCRSSKTSWSMGPEVLGEGPKPTLAQAEDVTIELELPPACDNPVVVGAIVPTMEELVCP